MSIDNPRLVIELYEAIVAELPKTAVGTDEQRTVKYTAKNIVERIARDFNVTEEPPF